MTKLVTADNFNRAETDRHFAAAIRRAGDIGLFHHEREFMAVDKQTVIRASRDTLSSDAVFDLDAGPVTVTVPDSGRRYLSMIVIDRDHYTPAAFHHAGQYTFERKQFGTRYVMVAVRIFVDPADPDDVGAAHALQDALEVRQKSSGRFEAPEWDPASQKMVREAFLVLATTIPDSRRMFGARGDVDPVRHRIGTAMGWGGSPEKETLYLSVTPRANDGTTIHRLKVEDVPVDGFWSISVYNAQGYFEPNRCGVYTLNSLTTKKDSDGSVTVQFGGYDEKVPNSIPIVPRWNYVVRLYRPRPEVLSYAWTFPPAELVVVR